MPIEAAHGCGKNSLAADAAQPMGKQQHSPVVPSIAPYCTCPVALNGVGSKKWEEAERGALGIMESAERMGESYSGNGGQLSGEG